MKIVAAALCLSLFGAPCLAAVMEATYAGKVINSLNGHTDFGPNETDPLALEGLSYKLSFIYDTFLGLREKTDDFDIILGQPYVAANPILSATITINGKSKSIMSMTNSVVQQYDASAYEENGETSNYFRLTARDYFFGQNPNQYRNRSLVVGSYSKKVRIDLEEPLTINNPKQLDAPFFGYFEFIYYDDETGLKKEFSLGSLTFESLRVRRYDGEPTPVPLPASGLLLAFGLAIMGLRSRVSNRLRLNPSRQATCRVPGEPRP